VLTVDGLRLRLNYLHNAYDQPFEIGESYLYRTTGNSYGVSLQQPLMVTRSRRLDVYAGVSYAEGDPVSRTQDVNRYPNDIHAHAQEPLLMLGMVYIAGNRFGRFMGDVKFTKGMDIFGLTPAYSATGRPQAVQINPDPDMHFMKLNTVLSQQIPLRREWRLGLSYRFQLSNRTLPLPMSQKIGFGDGGYASEGFSGDVGQVGRVGLAYQPAILARRFIPVSFELYYAAARIRNYSGELSYATATPQTVGLRTSFSIPQAYINGFIDVGKPFEATSVSRSKAIRVIFGIGQTF
jgi:hemolysin activation/secretion protein